MDRSCGYVDRETLPASQNMDSLRVALCIRTVRVQRGSGFPVDRLFGSCIVDPYPITLTKESPFLSLRVRTLRTLSIREMSSSSIPDLTVNDRTDRELLTNKTGILFSSDNEPYLPLASPLERFRMTPPRENDGVVQVQIHVSLPYARGKEYRVCFG
jgi:hypothetical protein